MRLIISTILAIIILSFLFGCGTRKTDTQQSENIIIENNYDTGSKIVLGNTFTYKPFDNLKPMVIEGKTYNNAIVSNDKSIIREVWKRETKYKTITIEKTKSTIRENHDFLYIGLFLVLILGILAWFKLPSFRKGI